MIRVSMVSFLAIEFSIVLVSSQSIDAVKTSFLLNYFIIKIVQLFNNWEALTSTL